MLSALGGSIRVKENYEDDDIPLYDEALIPEKARPWAQNPQFITSEEMIPMIPTKQSFPFQPPSVEKKEEKISKLNFLKEEDVGEVIAFDGGDDFAAIE
jgi:hypothetical protein